MPESLYNAPYLCMHRAELHDALASVLPADIIHLGKKLTGLDQAGGRVTLSFADGTQGDGGCRDRRRRRALDRARHHRRPGRADPPRPHRLPRGVSRIADGPRHRPLAHQMVGHRPPHRHLLHDESAQRGLLRHQRAGAGRVDHARVMVGQGRRERVARRLRRLPRRRARRARRLSRTATNGRSSSASRCRAGATAASCCSATRRIR